MAIGMGQSRERVRAEMIEVRANGEIDILGFVGTNRSAEDDPTGRKATRGKSKSCVAVFEDS